MGGPAPTFSCSSLALECFSEDGWKVKVGSVAHPMEDKHHIEWIAIYGGDRVHRKYLKPGDAPEAEFQCPAKEITAKEFCNLHGLWKA